MVIGERALEVEVLCERLVRWAQRVPTIRGMVMVGSWARETARMDSDLDVVVLSSDPTPFVDEARWIEAALGEAAPVVRTKAWGPMLTERRVRMSSGLEVELGFATLAWAATGPVDPGTARVLRDGCRVLFDPAGLFQAALGEVHGGQQPASESGPCW